MAPHRDQGTRCRSVGLPLAVVADREVAEERAQWRNPELQARVGATHFFVAEGVDAAIPG